MPLGDGDANLDIGVERRILNRFAFGPSSTDLADLRSSNIHTWLQTQLDPASIDDSAVENALIALNQNSPVSDNSTFHRAWTARCLYSKRQLLYRMVDFYENHFSTYFSKTQVLKEATENAAFKANAFKSFERMLLTSARGPCMQRYLDNHTNVAAQPNENYAREIMELHTLGVNSGYTEPDVAEAARVFTGWGYQTFNSGTPQEYVQFNFNAANHDSGPKTIMGWSTSGYAGDMGQAEGEEFIHYLATHILTCKRIAAKLCTYFVHEEASVSLRQKTEGMLSHGRPMSEILSSLVEYVAGDNDSARQKTQDPQEFVYSTIRRLDIPFTSSLTTINNWVTALGKQLFYQHLPTGYAEAGAQWNGAGSQLKKWEFINALTNDQISGLTIPWASMQSMSYTMRPRSRNIIIDELIERIADGELDSISRTNLRAFASARMSYWSTPATTAQETALTRDLIGLILRLPEGGTH
jgi:uncharacterized protein (DUF1800 family)